MNLAITVVIILGLFVSFKEYTNYQIQVQAIQKGLEQCPNPFSVTNKTIWVKDCNKFLKENNATKNP